MKNNDNHKSLAEILRPLTAAELADVEPISADDIDAALEEGRREYDLECKYLNSRNFYTDLTPFF